MALLLPLLIPQAANAQDKFLQTSALNLAKAAFALGAYEMNDNTKIDNYLALAECKIFKDYYSDDFEWKSIRDITRSYLQINGSKFPRTFEYLQPVIFETYDFKRQGFPLSPDTAFRSNTKLQISGNSLRAEPCAEPLELFAAKGIPGNALMVLKAPLDLRFVPIAQEKADPYIKSIAVRKSKDDRENRKVYARFRVELVDYLGEEAMGSGERFMQFEGMIKEITFFADYEQTYELHKFTGQPAPDYGLPPADLPDKPENPLTGN